MKKLNLLFTIFIGITILSCSSDDDNNQTPDNTSKLIKKVTLSNQNQTYSVNFSYNSDNSIDKLEYLDTGGDFIEQYFYNNGELDRILYVGIGLIGISLVLYFKNNNLYIFVFGLTLILGVINLIEIYYLNITFGIGPKITLNRQVLSLLSNNLVTRNVKTNYIKEHFDFNKKLRLTHMKMMNIQYQELMEMETLTFEYY